MSNTDQYYDMQDFENEYDRLAFLAIWVCCPKKCYTQICLMIKKFPQMRLSGIESRFREIGGHHGDILPIYLIAIPSGRVAGLADEESEVRPIPTYKLAVTTYTERQRMRVKFPKLFVSKKNLENLDHVRIDPGDSQESCEKLFLMA